MNGQPSDDVLHAQSLADLPDVLALLQRACHRAGADATVLADLRLASEEVFTNILHHGYRRACGPITISAQPQADAITVTLSDQAPPFDPASLPRADTQSSWQTRPVGGLGWHLVHQLMDEVSRKPGQPSGNVYVLVKRLPTRSPTQHPNEE